jgi:hypothetical protein
MSRALALVLLALAGCHDGHGVVTVTVTTATGSIGDVDHLTLRITDQTRTPARTSTPITVAVPEHSIPPAQTIPLVFDQSVDGAIVIAADAVLGDGTVISASVPARVSTYHALAVTLELPAPMPMPSGDMATCAGVMPTHTRKFVVNRIVVPMSRHDYAIDLNGDGVPDNALGTFYNAFSSQNVNSQASTDSEIAAGQDIVLLTLGSSDAGFTVDPCALTQLQNGKNQANPDFSSGMGAFTVDPAAATAFFGGPLISAAFDSLPLPPVATTPVRMALKLPMMGQALVPVTAGHIHFTVAGSGLMSGQIQGAISTADVNGYLVPGLQAQLNAAAMQSPCGANCMQVRQLFDTGGKADPACGTTCKNPDGTCAKANDGVISYCEVATSGIIQNILLPDVQLTDGLGHYKPNPANSVKDSFSIGLGFTAVPAVF